jgi:hypothetical protein
MLSGQVADGFATIFVGELVFKQFFFLLFTPEKNTTSYASVAKNTHLSVPNIFVFYNIGNRSFVLEFILNSPNVFSYMISSYKTLIIA